MLSHGVQSLASHLSLQRCREIQQTLVDIEDKEPSFVGSKEWIGAIEISFVLDKLLGVSGSYLFYHGSLPCGDS